MMLQRKYFLHTDNLKGDCAVPSNLSHEEFEEFIWQQFPLLHGNKLIFAIGKANGDLAILPEDCTPASLKGDRTKRCIYIMPSDPVISPQNKVGCSTQ